MVRVVSQSFNHPRSRHSSGETDLDLAQRADSALALSTLRAKRTDLADYESSSDSFWDSEHDMDQQDLRGFQKGSTEDEINGNESLEKSDVYIKRKERRRERNKVSAQAYRQRRRQVNVSTQQELSLLEERNRQLLKKVHDLEQQTEQAKQILKGQVKVSTPDFLFPNKTNSNLLSTTSSHNIAQEPQKTNATISDDSLSSPCPSLDSTVNNSPNFGFGKNVQNNPQFLNGNDIAMPINANLPPVNPVNLNALASTATPIFNTSPSPSLSPGEGLPSAKPKQNFFNANHYYKIPIHHHKTLRTVHEVPSNISNDEEEGDLLTVTNQPRVCDSSGFTNNGAKASCDEFGINNGNMNLINMNERMNSNLLTTKDDKIWNSNSAFLMNPLKAVNMNDNANSALSKPHVQNSPPLLLHSNSFVQLIITAGENTMPSQ